MTDRKRTGDLVLDASGPASLDLQTLEGRTFQVHVLPGAKLHLYPVEIDPDLARCPVIVGGERCGGKAGHSGKHQWNNGD